MPVWRIRVFDSKEGKVASQEYLVRFDTDDGASRVASTLMGDSDHADIEAEPEKASGRPFAGEVFPLQ